MTVFVPFFRSLINEGDQAGFKAIPDLDAPRRFRISARRDKMRKLVRFLGAPCGKLGVSRLPRSTARLRRRIVIAAVFAALAQAQGMKIKSFSVGPDQTLTYPNGPANPPFLVDL